MSHWKVFFSNVTRKKTFKANFPVWHVFFRKFLALKSDFHKIGPFLFCERNFANEALWLVHSDLLSLFKKKLSHTTFQCVNFRKFSLENPFQVLLNENFPMWHRPYKLLTNCGPPALLSFPVNGFTSKVFSVHASVDAPQTVGFAIQLLQTVAKDVFICTVGRQRAQSESTLPVAPE